MNKKSLAVCLILVVMFVIGCTQSTPYPDEPPDAVGLAEGKEIMLIKGSYQWNYAIADAPSPDDLVRNATVYVVKPSTELTLKFMSEEPEKVWAGLWENNNFTPLPSDKHTIRLPSNPGKYVLSVGGEWQGDDHASYAAAIEVRQ